MPFDLKNNTTSFFCQTRLTVQKKIMAPFYNIIVKSKLLSALTLTPAPTPTATPTPTPSPNVTPTPTPTQGGFDRSRPTVRTSQTYTAPGSYGATLSSASSRHQELACQQFGSFAANRLVVQSLIRRPLWREPEVGQASGSHPRNWDLTNPLLLCFTKMA